MFTMCAAAVIINLTPVWTVEDGKVLKRATFVCETRYKSCLKKLIKKEESLFNAICGESKGEVDVSN